MFEIKIFYATVIQFKTGTAAITVAWCVVEGAWCQGYWPTWSCRQSWQWSQCAVDLPPRWLWSDAPARGHAPLEAYDRRRRSLGVHVNPGCTESRQTYLASLGWWWPEGKGGGARGGRRGDIISPIKQSHNYNTTYYVTGFDTYRYLFWKQST